MKIGTQLQNKINRYYFIDLLILIIFLVFVFTETWWQTVKICLSCGFWLFSQSKIASNSSSRTLQLRQSQFLFDDELFLTSYCTHQVAFYLSQHPLVFYGTSLFTKPTFKVRIITTYNTKYYSTFDIQVESGIKKYCPIHGYHPLVILIEVFIPLCRFTSYSPRYYIYISH